ncbi:hypothetical protein [Aquimarina algiphila]|uniref:Uncharacterized protein n=1 Tax=Aquimarina algiphila TaxID=2047982 RepID=A0A554VBM3_9FLAO|nr:hypothetical protein [Aquimarina algiphila]TSE03933.1 hypothetical protein FOF46_28120 [Aquimarina algiphila]
MHKTIYNPDFKVLKEDRSFGYQKELTEKLDNLREDFDQNTLNEIVLWKVNRYALFSNEAMALINSIGPSETKLNKDKISVILFKLLKTKGVQLPMASTILRFKNPILFQIIDQRVFRIIYPNETLKLNSYPSEKNIKFQVDLYLKYLEDLKDACKRLEIPFEKSDRILFMADRRINKEISLNNY